MSLNGSALEAELARYGLSLTTRAEWGARAPKSTPSQMTIPSPRVWIHHAAIESSDDGAEMRAHQAFHMDQRGWNDIAYSLCIPDPNPGGVVFEGRGIGIDGGHTATENTESHGLCVLGNFQVDHPSQATIDVLVTLLRAGRIEGWWADPVPATNIGGHRDAPTANTSCPGDHLYDDIPTIRIRATEDDDDMPLNDADKAAIRRILRQEIPGILRDAIGKTEGVDGEAAAQVRARAKEGAAAALDEHSG